MIVKTQVWFTVESQLWLELHVECLIPRPQLSSKGQPNPSPLAPRARWQVGVQVFLSKMLLLFHGLFSSLSLLPIRSQMFAAEENVDFRIHVENQTRARDDVSRKQLRLYQLYSRTSGKHIQVLGRRISAKGEDGDKYGKNIYWDAPDSRSKALILLVGLRTSWDKNKSSNKKTG